MIIELENMLIVELLLLILQDRKQQRENLLEDNADAIEKNKILNKKVYGLFIAINIDTNTKYFSTW